MEKLSVECVETLHGSTYSATVVGIQKVLNAEVEATARVNVRCAVRMSPAVRAHEARAKSVFR